MTEYLQNCRFYRTINVEKTSYFEIAPPGHTIANKNVDNLLKNIKFIF